MAEGNFHQPLGYACANTLLARFPRPTAIFASNDVSATGVMEAVRDAGLRIPDDVSVVGFDDIPAASQVHPPLSTVRQPLAAMGRTAADTLLALIAGRAVSPQRRELPTELVVRRSSGPVVAAVPS